MKEIIANLLKVKSLVTLAITGLFVYLGIKGEISQEVMTVFSTIIAFFFGTKVGQAENNIEDIDKTE